MAPSKNCSLVIVLSGIWTVFIVKYTTAVDCQPGYKVVNNLCEECGVNYYQPMKQQLSCIPCPIGHITFSLKNATSLTDCKVNCSSGTELNRSYAGLRSLTSACLDCPRGYYRDATNITTDACQICPTDFITRFNQRATRAEDCTIRNCTTPGQYRNPTTNLCLRCEIGTFSNTKWEDQCVRCPPGLTTEKPGAIYLNDCLLDCPSGQEEKQRQCVPCAKGTYRDKASSFRCQNCTSGLFTITTGATSETECNVPPCIKGEFYNLEKRKCQKCPLKYYQDSNGQFDCFICPNGKYTEDIGSDDITDCKSYCDNRKYNDCGNNTMCSDDVSKGFVCTCIANYHNINGTCTHQCDTGYCFRGKCTRGSTVYCACPDGYTGTRCENREVGLTILEKIVAGTITCGVGLLIVIGSIVCFCTKKRHIKVKKTVYKDDSLSNSDKDELSYSMPEDQFNMIRGNPVIYNNLYGEKLGGDDPAVYEFK